MSDRAALSLVARAWDHVERGSPGLALRLLTQAAGSEKAARTVHRARAELEAECGNQLAALSLLTELDGDLEDVAMVRARIAAARGDWRVALSEADRAVKEPAANPRAVLVRERARVSLGDPLREPDLHAVETGGGHEGLHAALLRAHTKADGIVGALESVAERAREQGAVRIEAEAWTDLCALHESHRDEQRARAAAARAVELWEQMATTLPPQLRSGFWSDARRRAVRASSKPSLRNAPRPDDRTALLASIRTLASERDLSTLLGRITDSAVSLSGAERGFVLLVDERGKLEPHTIRSAEEKLGAPTAGFSTSIAETVLIDGVPVVTVDAAHDARVRDYMSVHQLMLKSVACLPMATRGRTWGVLYLEHRSAAGRFSATELTLLQAFADQAALAIETAYLLTRTEQQKHDLQLANEALQAAKVELESRLADQSEVLERTRSEVARLRNRDGDGERWGLVGVSEPMRRVYEVLERVAQSDVPVAITGESGTGKELVARAIHRASGRANARWISLNSGAMPEGLLESELFGHVPGAFTGATRAHDGVFVQANGGTLFMDEIADMPPRMQLDLLRVLQDGRIRPVGASEEIPVDVRILTASRRPLRVLVDAGGLREDLYYRLAVVEIRLPPLRERRSDIPLLCDHFLIRISQERGEPKKRLSPGALQRLCGYDFPGNVRELEHLLINATMFAQGDAVEAEELALDASTSELAVEAGDYREFKDIERAKILDALNAHAWNRAQAARSLGMPRRTFYRRLKEHGIELPTKKP